GSGRVVDSGDYSTRVDAAGRFEAEIRPVLISRRCDPSRESEVHRIVAGFVGDPDSRAELRRRLTLFAEVRAVLGRRVPAGAEVDVSFGEMLAGFAHPEPGVIRH